MKYRIVPLKLKNTKFFERWLIDPYHLTLSQRNYVDRLITIFKPYLNDLINESLIKNLIYDYIDITSISNSPKCNFSHFRSIVNQIDNFENNKKTSNNKKRALQISPQFLECLSLSNK